VGAAVAWCVGVILRAQRKKQPRRGQH
jgi:hypothetical protein